MTMLTTAEIRERVFDADAANPLRVECSQWNGEERVDLRRMFYTRTGDLAPTKKGIGLEIKGGTARAVLEALRTVNGQPARIADPYGVIVVERREYKGTPFLDVRRHYKGAPSHHGVSLTADIEADVVAYLAELIGVEPDAPVNAPAPVTATPPRPAATGDPERAAKLRGLADGLQKTIDDKTRPMTQNPTPKRNREYAERLHEGANWQRCQTALNLMAAALEAGTLPDVLHGVKTKAAVYDLVYTRGKSEGYYDYRDSGEYADTSAAGRALQAMLDGTCDPDAERRARIHLLESRARLQVGQIPGFFPTPEAVVTELLRRAGHINRTDKVLEPSAGMGNIADRLREFSDCVDVCEVHSALREILTLKEHRLVATDFMDYVPGRVYDVIVMNPPFENGQDVAHVYHAYNCLAPGGRLVSVLSASVEFNRQRKYADFRDWLDSVGGYMERLPEDAFKPSGTNVNTVVVVIDRD